LGFGIDSRFELATASANQVLRIAARHSDQLAKDCHTSAIEHLRTQIRGFNAHELDRKTGVPASRR
jgi:hypothetical protein